MHYERAEHPEGTERSSSMSSTVLKTATTSESSPRNRMARIRVFDPACGSGNFLVVAYKEMREIEAEINRRRAEADRASDIPLTNFRGIEIRSFAAEVARLALVIAEFQCDLEYRGRQLALSDALPLKKSNWITCGNALRLNWMDLCPPTNTKSRISADGLFEIPLDQSEIDFENEGGETYICGNPPFAGLSSQTKSQKHDLELLFADKSKYWKSFDYVMGWMWKARQLLRTSDNGAAFVTTNSVCQGQLVPMFWPLLLTDEIRISFAHTSFQWSNLAARQAAVTVVVTGLAQSPRSPLRIYESDEVGDTSVREVTSISPYLIPGKTTYVQHRRLSDRPEMVT